MFKIWKSLKTVGFQRFLQEAYIKTKKIPVIIDCDPGHDDAIALIMAFADENIDVIGVTPVAGNQTLDKTSENARKILTFLNKRVPVARGAKKPLVRELRTAPEVHGKSGLDGPSLPPADFEFENKPAWELQYQLITTSDTPVTVVAIGPLTNIALLLTAFPKVKQNIERICIMGGGFQHGNSTPLAEFNILVDPEAAHIVFESGLPIVLCPLDVTEKAYITPGEITQLQQSKNPVADFTATLLSFYSKYHLALGFEGCHIHDACAVVYISHPELFKTEDMFVTVETAGRYTTGMTVADRRFNTKAHIQADPKNTLLPGITEPNVRVCVDVDRRALFELLKTDCKILSDLL